MTRISLHNSQLELNNIHTFIECGNNGDDLSDGNDNIESDDDNWDDRKSNNAMDMNNKLGVDILSLWNKREKQIVSDFTILGWLLCPVEEVHIDMNANYKRKHMNSAENVIRKLLCNDSDEEFDEHFNTFCEEHPKFMKKLICLILKKKCGNRIYSGTVEYMNGMTFIL